MPATIPSLWPDDIKVDVLPPLVILKTQASKIGEITQGILAAEVTTVTGSDDLVSHRLDLVAPSLEGRRYRVLTATTADFYPVVLEADCFRPKASYSALPEPFGPVGAGPRPWPLKNDWRPVANDQDEFLKRVGEVLRSGEVRAVINSMIALSNEKNGQPDDGTETAA